MTETKHYIFGIQHNTCGHCKGGEICLIDLGCIPYNFCLLYNVISLANNSPGCDKELVLRIGLRFFTRKEFKIPTETLPSSPVGKNIDMGSAVYAVATWADAPKPSLPPPPPPPPHPTPPPPPGVAVVSTITVAPLYVRKALETVPGFDLNYVKVV